MINKLWISFKIACQNIKSNLLHTLLSTLGIVIGVAALVTILSLIDGMEEFARSQITETTSLRSIIVESRSRKQVDGVWIENENYPVITPQKVNLLKKQLTKASSLELRTSGSATLQLTGQPKETATYFYALSSDSIKTDKIKMIAGSNIFKGRYTAVISKTLAEALTEENSSNSLLGSTFVMKGRDYTISGIFEDGKEARRGVVVPLSSLSKMILQDNAPKLAIEAKKVEEVEALKTRVQEWLAKNYKEVDQNFNIFTNQMRVQQARKGMMLFKIIMGLITGIAVVVGGIGVMNVLLISVTERTTEIGIRKATGAKKFDIIFQFLSESVTISVLGSIVGVVFGVFIAMASVPIVKYMIDIPFEAGFTMSTLVIIAALAIIVGILFGTYPAMRAARLTPVEAIRRE